MNKPITLSEREASLVLSNWTAIEGRWRTGAEPIALWNILPRRRLTPIFQAFVGASDRAPSATHVASAILVRPARRRR